MATKQNSLAKKAGELWDRRDLKSLVKFFQKHQGAKDPEIFYYAGLAFSALNRKRETIACWRKAVNLRPEEEKYVRALAYELAESAAVEAAELFHRLSAWNRANADDLTSLGEIRIMQDRLGEAQKLLQKALELEHDNSLALLAMATLYAHVRGRDLTLAYLKKLARTGDIDLSDLASDPEFEFLWHDPEFEKIIS